MQETLQENISSSARLEWVSDYNTVTNGILDLCEKNGAALIVMGITGASGKLDEVVIGSNALDVSRRSHLPVIIVPANAAFRPIKKILLAVDFKKVVESTPVAPVKEILDATQAELHVLHVETDTHDFTPDTPFESLMLDELFRGYNPQYHFEKDHDFTDAMIKFATGNNIDLIITFPKKHGFFEGIFKRSHTKSLAFHSHIPLMTIHE